MVIKKEVFLLSLINLFAATALHSMDAPAMNVPAENEQAPTEQKTTKEQYTEAKKRHLEVQDALSQAAHDLQEKIHSDTTHCKRELISQCIRHGFRIVDHGIASVFYEWRKNSNLLSEEEELALAIQREDLKNKLVATRVTASTAKSKDAEVTYLESQTLQVDIANAVALCNQMSQGFENPKCIKMFNELAARAGMNL